MIFEMRKQNANKMVSGVYPCGIRVGGQIKMTRTANDFSSLEDCGRIVKFKKMFKMDKIT